MRTLWAAATATVVLTLSACGPKVPDPTVKPEVRYAVEVAAVTAKPISHRIVATGSLAPFEVVRATARVGGVVERLLVAEGDRVDAGQALAEIEPERFRLAVRTSRAALDRARAVVDDAASGLKRREDLSRSQPTLVKEEELAQFRARSAQAEADLASARVALERAQLDLHDAQVAAPIAGVIQERGVET
nr:biotin/lipoyl-binding protein [Planctomycetota bacterium]